MLLEPKRLAQRKKQLRVDSIPSKDASAVLRNFRRYLPPSTLAELLSRYNAGEHTPGPSGAYGISKTGLRELLQVEGVMMRGQAIKCEDALRAVQLYESGHTIKAVVRHAGISFATNRRVLQENGVPMRSTGIEMWAATNDRPYCSQATRR